MATQTDQLPLKLPDLWLPAWEQLPTVPLHLDQLLAFTNQYLADITGETMTKTMMHNYFKAQVLVPPDKKSYHQIHLAGAIIVGALKNIFTLDELKTALHFILDVENPQAGYDRFVTTFNHEAHNGQFRTENLSDEQLTEMSPAAIIQYDAVKALLFWLSAKRLLHAVTTK